MEIDERDAAGESECEGKTYYFCAPGSKRVFDNHPEKYTTAGGRRPIHNEEPESTLYTQQGEPTTNTNRIKE